MYQETKSIKIKQFDGRWASMKHVVSSHDDPTMVAWMLCWTVVDCHHTIQVHRTWILLTPQLSQLQKERYLRWCNYHKEYQPVALMFNKGYHQRLWSLWIECLVYTSLKTSCDVFRYVSMIKHCWSLVPNPSKLYHASSCYMVEHLTQKLKSLTLPGSMQQGSLRCGIRWPGRSL